MSNCIIYRHIRLDNNQVFYIGIGKSEKRAYGLKGRNRHWENIVNKTDYEVQILKKDLTWKEACELETILIDYYGRDDLGKGNLVNMTDGGDGANGYIPSIGMRKKISKLHTGKIVSQKTRDKIGKAMTGFKYSEESKKKQSEAKKGRKQEWVIQIGKNNAKPIIQYSIEGDFIREWPSIISVQKELGIKQSCISDACRGKIKTAGKFKWKFKEHKNSV